MTYGMYPEPVIEPDTPDLMPRPTVASLRADFDAKWAAYRAHQVRGFDSKKDHDRLEKEANEAFEVWTLAKAAYGDEDA